MWALLYSHGTTHLNFNSKVDKYLNRDKSRLHFPENAFRKLFGRLRALPNHPMAATCVAKPPLFAAHFFPTCKNHRPVARSHSIYRLLTVARKATSHHLRQGPFSPPSSFFRLSACLPPELVACLSVISLNLNNDEPQPQSGVFHTGVLRGRSSLSVLVLVLVLVTIVTYSLCVDRGSVILFRNAFAVFNITVTPNSNRTNNEDATRQELSFSSQRYQTQTAPTR